MAIEHFFEDPTILHAPAYVPVLVAPAGPVTHADLRRVLEPVVEGSRLRLDTWRRLQPPVAILVAAGPPPGGAQLRALGAKMQSALARSDVRPWVVFGGVSRDRDAAVSVSNSLGDVLELARLVYAAPATVLAAEVATYAVLLENPRLLAVLRDVLAPFGRVSRGEELVDTLEAFFEEDLNVSRAAGRLGVHRHTVSLRLRRVCAVLGATPWEHPARMRFELALQARRLTTPRRQAP